jgi:methylmalonyl-CoA mutase
VIPPRATATSRRSPRPCAAGTPETERLAERAADAAALERAQAALDADAARALRDARDAALAELGPDLATALREWPELRARYAADTQSYEVRGRAIDVANHVETLSHTRLPEGRAAAHARLGELTRFLRRENLPGAFPFTAGVFPFKRGDEDPTRHVRGGGHARAHQPPLPPRLARDARGAPVDRVRLGDALRPRPGAASRTSSARSATRASRSCTVDDAKKLYSGFDLGAPTSSVSMTINGPRRPCSRSS